MEHDEIGDNVELSKITTVRFTKKFISHVLRTIFFMFRQFAANLQGLRRGSPQMSSQ